MANNVNNKVQKSNSGPNKGMAFLGIFLTWLGFLIVFLTNKEDHYAMHYAKQGLVIGICWVALSFVGIGIGFIPIIGWILTPLLWIGMFVLWIIGIIYSLSGVEKDIPIIGKIAQKFNF